MHRVLERLGVSIREYRELEAGIRWPSFETFDRICKLYGWQQTFASGIRR
jgi:transcriptional regulator with XRE-family HTH domain